MTIAYDDSTSIPHTMISTHSMAFRRARVCRFATFLFVFALLAGCAATVSRPTATAESKIVPSVAARQKLVLQVDGNSEMKSSPDWEPYLDEWQTSMGAAALSSDRHFVFARRDGMLPNEPATLVRVTVNDFKYVTQAKRYAVGIFAGNAYMDVDVEYLELPANTSLGKRKFSTASSAWQGVFSAMTPKQVEAVSNEIVKDIAPR